MRNNLEINFYDLLVKLLEKDPQRRISWKKDILNYMK